MSTKKIKKFKINLRFRDIVRNLKSTAKTCEITKEIEELIDNESDRAQKIITPSSVFETVSKEKLHFPVGVEAPPKWVAASFFIVSVGPGADAEMASLAERNEIVVERVMHSIFMEALEQSANFINRLLGDEAKDEDCELSQRVTVSSAETIQEVLKILPFDKIGVSYPGENGFQPQFTSCEVVFWTPIKKRGSKK
jgi:hypothetical protein